MQQGISRTRLPGGAACKHWHGGRTVTTPGRGNSGCAPSHAAPRVTASSAGSAQAARSQSPTPGLRHARNPVAQHTPKTGTVPPCTGPLHAADSRGRRTFCLRSGGASRFPHPRQLSLLLRVRFHVQLLAGCRLLCLLALYTYKARQLVQALVLRTLREAVHASPCCENAQAVLPALSGHARAMVVQGDSLSAKW